VLVGRAPNVIGVVVLLLVIGVVVDSVLNSVWQFDIIDPTTLAAVAFIVAKHALQAGPSCIKVGQKQASPSGQDVAAELMVAHAEQTSMFTVAIIGAVVGSSDWHSLIMEDITAASVTLTVRRQLLQAGPNATAVGQKQALSGQDVAAATMMEHWEH